MARRSNAGKRRAALAAAVLLGLAGTAAASSRDLKGANLANLEGLGQAKAQALTNAVNGLKAKVPNKLSFQVPTVKAGTKDLKVPAGKPSIKLEPQSKTVNLPSPKVELGKMTVSVPVAQLKWGSKQVQVPSGLKFDVSVPVKDLKVPSLELAKQNVDLAIKFGDVATVDLKRASMDQLAATLGQLQASSDAINSSARAKLCGSQAAATGGALSKMTFGATGKACAGLELEQAKVNAGIALVKQALDAKAKLFAQLKGGMAGAAAPAAMGAASASADAAAPAAPKPCACPKIMAPVCNGKGMKFDNECLAKCSGAKVIKAC